MADDQTIQTYDAKAADYAARFAGGAPSTSLNRFMALLPERAHVLDLGCGPGNASFHLREAGFTPDPVDASAAMVEIARETFGLEARQARFDAPFRADTYHGVWANFSLLHAARADFPGHLAALNRALLPGGVFHLGMKTGEGERRDTLGRFYTFYEIEDLRRYLAAAGFDVLDVHEGIEAGLAGTPDPFVLILARKAGISGR